MSKWGWVKPLIIRYVLTMLLLYASAVIAQYNDWPTIVIVVKVLIGITIACNIVLAGLLAYATLFFREES